MWLKKQEVECPPQARLHLAKLNLLTKEQRSSGLWEKWEKTSGLGIDPSSH